MAGRFSICVYSLLEKRSALGEPKLGSKCCLRMPDHRAGGRPDYNKGFNTRAIPAADPNNKLEYMKPIFQTANVEGETVPLREVIPFWFAVSSPLLGALLGLLGAWFVAWVSA